MAERKMPTIDELKRMYDEGVEQPLLSGLKVKMRPVQPDALLMSGSMPDILTPLVIKILQPAEEEAFLFPDEVNKFIDEPRGDKKSAIEFIQAVNHVCTAALVDASIVPYLTISDRLWVFKLAFYPAEVLSTFRYQPSGNVEAIHDGEQEPQQAKSADVPDGAVLEPGGVSA